MDALFDRYVVVHAYSQNSRGPANPPGLLRFMSRITRRCQHSLTAMAIESVNLNESFQSTIWAISIIVNNYF